MSWVQVSKVFWKFLTITPSFCIIILASFCGSDGELVASLDPESREPRLQPLPGVVLCTSFSQEYRWVLGNYNGNFINTWKSSYGMTLYPEGEGILLFASCHWNHQDGLWQSWVTWLGRPGSNLSGQCLFINPWNWGIFCIPFGLNI